MKYELSQDILTNFEHTHKCIVFFDELLKNKHEYLYGEHNKEDEEKFDGQKYLNEVNPDIQCCIDTIWIVCGWLGFQTHPVDDDYVKRVLAAPGAAREAINDIVEYLANKNAGN